MSDGSELFRIKVEPPGAHIAVSGESTFVVILGRAGPIWELEAMLEAVQHIVGLFEPDFAAGTGSPAAPAGPSLKAGVPA